MSEYWNRWQRRRLGRRGFIGAAGATGLGAAALGLVGCGDDDDDDDNGNGGGNGDPTEEVSIDELRDMSLEDMRVRFGGTRLKDLPGNADQPVTGGALRFASRAPVTWDPTSPAGGLMASYMWANNQLIQIKVNDWVENPNFMEFEPVLTETMPEQPDELTYVFKIPRGIKFQDVDPVNGRELTADDIVYCSEVYRDTPAQSPTYSEVDKIEKIDDYTVRMTTLRPAAYFISSLAVPFHWIFSREQHESSDGLAGKPIGTGGFLLESFEDQGGYKFVKNPNYFRKDPRTGMQLPYLDSLETTYYPNPAQSIAAFRAGEFDHVWPQNRDTWLTVMESNPDSVTQITTPPPSFQPYIAVRQDTGPMADPRVRQALSLMVDRDAIISSLAQGMAGYGYGQDWTYFGNEWPWESSELGNWNRHDVGEARQLLEAAGVGDLTLDFLFTQFAGFNFEVWQAVAGMWDQEGIKTVIDAPQDAAAWQSQFYGSTYKGLVGTGLLGPGMDPDTFTYHALHSESPKNTFTVNDPKIDELALKQRQTFDREERVAVLEELMEYDLDQVTRIWLVTPYKFNLRKPNTFSLTDTEAAWNPVGWGSVGLDTAWKRA